MLLTWHKLLRDIRHQAAAYCNNLLFHYIPCEAMQEVLLPGEDFVPLVTKFETLQKLLEKAAQAEQEPTIHLDIRSKYGDQSTITAFLDTGSKFNWITQSACQSLHIPDQDFSNVPSNKRYNFRN